MKMLRAVAALCSVVAMVACTAHPVQPASETGSEIGGPLLDLGGGGLGSGSRADGDTIPLVDASGAESASEDGSEPTVERGGGGLGSGS
jgi:hypothetical protein